MKKIKTRFSPSPTGLMHIGNARTALFNALYALKYDGVFLLRIEDTDSERSQTKYIDALCEDLRWLGLTWQEGYGIYGATVDEVCYQQSKRGDIYQHYFQQLSGKGSIYPCFCSAEKLAISRKMQLKSGQPPRYDGSCRNLTEVDLQASHTLRFKVDSGKTDIDDFVKGKQSYDNETIGDFIIKRSHGAEGFFFVNAIDDALMEVSHVLRGEDHLTNTPRQIMILQALALPLPRYGHIALTLGSDGKPLSKRNGSMSISELREDGYLPEALVNYLARLGHSYDNNQLLSLTELAQQFDEARIGKAPARFDINHLHHWQQMALNSYSNEMIWQWICTQVEHLVPVDKTLAFVETVRANVLFPHDALKWAEHLFTDVVVSAVDKATVAQTPRHFFTTLLDGLNKKMPYGELVNYLKTETMLTGKALFMPLRIALTGCSFGPELAKILPLMDGNLLTKRVEYFL